MVNKAEQKQYLFAIGAIVAIVGIVVLVLNSGTVSVNDDLSGQTVASSYSATSLSGLTIRGGEKLGAKNLEFGKWYRVWLSDKGLIAEKVTSRTELKAITKQITSLSAIQTPSITCCFYTETGLQLEEGVLYLARSDGQYLIVYPLNEELFNKNSWGNPADL